MTEPKREDLMIGVTGLGGRIALNVPIVRTVPIALTGGITVTIAIVVTTEKIVTTAKTVITAATGATTGGIRKKTGTKRESSDLIDHVATSPPETAQSDRSDLTIRSLTKASNLMTAGERARAALLPTRAAASSRRCSIRSYPTRYPWRPRS